MKTGAGIIETWHKQYRGYRLSKNGMAHLRNSIDAAIQAAQVEGEIAGAERMVEVVRRTTV